MPVSDSLADRQSADQLAALGVATSTSDPRARTVSPAKPHAAIAGLRDRA
jgi:hypothetical protein